MKVPLPGGNYELRFTCVKPACTDHELLDLDRCACLAGFQRNLADAIIEGDDPGFWLPGEGIRMTQNMLNALANTCPYHRP